MSDKYKIRAVNRKFYDKCKNNTEICPLIKKGDIRSKNDIRMGNLAKVVFLFISWMAIGKSVSSGSSYFTSILLFAFPLLSEGIYYKVEEERFKKAYKWQMILCVILVLIGILGSVVPVFAIEVTAKAKYIKILDDFIIFAGVKLPVVEAIWGMIGVVVILVSYLTFSQSSLLEEYFSKSSNQNGASA